MTWLDNEKMSCLDIDKDIIKMKEINKMKKKM